MGLFSRSGSFSLVPGHASAYRGRAARYQPKIMGVDFRGLRHHAIFADECPSGPQLVFPDIPGNQDVFREFSKVNH